MTRDDVGIGPISGLAAGGYEMTTYHHDEGFNAGTGYVVAARAEDIVPDVVFARPDDLHTASNEHGQLHGLGNIVLTDPPTEPAPQKSSVHLYVGFFEARNLRRQPSGGSW